MNYLTDLKTAAYFPGVPLWFMELFHEHNQHRRDITCLEVCRLFMELSKDTKDPNEIKQLYFKKLKE